MLYLDFYWKIHTRIEGNTVLYIFDNIDQTYYSTVQVR